jgi:hypothetical protein
MKGILLPLTGIMLCAAPFHSTAADPAVPLQTKQGEESHAVVTDMPDIIDMSHADPRTWHGLPRAAQVNDRSSKELDQPTGFNFESSKAAIAVIGSMPLVK